MQITGVTEHKGKNYITYTFENSNIFYETGYKGLRASREIGLIRCNYMTYNGNIRLLYHIDHYCTLAMAILSMSPNAFANLIINILDVILEIKNSGFIYIETVELEPQNLYVDVEELKPYFIYVPVNVKSTPENYYAMVNYLKKSIAYLIQTNSNLQSDLTTRILRELSDHSISIENLKSNISDILGIYREVGDNPYREILYADKKIVTEQIMESDKTDKKRNWFKHDKKKEEVVFAETSVLMEEFVPQIALISTDPQSNLEFVVNKKEYVIGHRSDVSDACIESNTGISRRHCKICSINGRYYILDLGSTNGTFVNGKRISPEHNVEIAPGDKIKLADEEFLITNISGAGRSQI